jgi:lipopolysaccharide transport system ATP-binding protein
MVFAAGDVMSEIAVSIKNVSKCYKRYAHPVDRLKELLLPGKSRADEFWALQDINLEIYQGETLGIVGRNGSGKSTLLQIIAGTLTPTTGEVRVNGRVSALLELGSGFNPEFTGRENVFLNGRLLGLSQREIEDKFDEIVRFADIGDFLDQPVKTYSSGMFVRLAFAIVANCSPQILIVDEALSVGDIFFQQKCFAFLEKLKSDGTAIIFVSHDTQAVLKLCDRAVMLQSGHLMHSGSPSDVVSKYIEMHYSQFGGQKALELLASEVDEKSETSTTSIAQSDALVLPETFTHEFPGAARYGCAVGLIAGVAITCTDGKPKSVVQVGEEIILSVKINRHSEDFCPLNVGFQIKDRLGQVVIGTNTCFLAVDMDNLQFGQPFICQFKVNLPIYPQKYTINAAVGEYVYDIKVIYDWIEPVGVVEVVSGKWLKQIGLCSPPISVKTSHVSNVDTFSCAR